jgi:hypothetical protein
VLWNPLSQQNHINLSNPLDFGGFRCHEFMQLAERADFSRSAACRKLIINKLFTISVNLSKIIGFAGACAGAKISM